DDTPENLAYVLARQWPSAGILTAEGALVLGSHAMKREVIFWYFGLLKLLLDGGGLQIGGKNSGSFPGRGTRLTMGLQVQPLAFRAFLDRSEGLARSTGFLARVLLCWPRSTQGDRPYAPLPQGSPRMSAFHQRIAEILKMPVPLNDNGTLCPQ